MHQSSTTKSIPNLFSVPAHFFVYKGAKIWYNNSMRSKKTENETGKKIDGACENGRN
jgi:hypothetical protein